jgi:hypothetical protein
VKKLVSDDFIATPSPTQRHALGSSVPDREDPEASRRRDTLHQDGGSDDDDTDDEEGTTLTDDGSAQSLDALEEQFHFLEEEVATLVADVHDLALYTKLNITGFMKILKVRYSIISVLPLFTSVVNCYRRNTMYVTMPYTFISPLTQFILPAEANPDPPYPGIHSELSRETPFL